MQTENNAAGTSPRGTPSPGNEPAQPTGIDLVARIKAPRPTRRSCQRYIRQRLTADLPAIANALLSAARTGGMPELKMLLHLSGWSDKQEFPRKSKPRGRSFADMLLDHIRKERLNDDGSEDPAGPDREQGGAPAPRGYLGDAPFADPCDERHGSAVPGGNSSP
jgi:hypothetical protein